MYCLLCDTADESVAIHATCGPVIHILGLATLGVTISDLGLGVDGLVNINAMHTQH